MHCEGKKTKMTEQKKQCNSEAQHRLLLFRVRRSSSSAAESRAGIDSMTVGQKTVLPAACNHRFISAVSDHTAGRTVEIILVCGNADNVIHEVFSVTVTFNDGCYNN